MKYINYRDWAFSNKAEVVQTAEKKNSGSFVLALVKAFMLADNLNSMILLNAFPKYFKEIYTHYENLSK